METRARVCDNRKWIYSHRIRSELCKFDPLFLGKLHVLVELPAYEKSVAALLESSEYFHFPRGQTYSEAHSKSCKQFCKRIFSSAQNCLLTSTSHKCYLSSCHSNRPTSLLSTSQRAILTPFPSSITINRWVCLGRQSSNWNVVWHEFFRPSKLY